MILPLISDYLLLVYDFCILILYVATLLNSLTLIAFLRFCQSFYVPGDNYGRLRIKGRWCYRTGRWAPLTKTELWR